LDPCYPSAGEAFVMKHIQDNKVFNHIEGILKVQFENDNFSLGLVTNVQELKSPSKAILNTWTINEAILVIMNH
jgi:hypothetical protein